MLAPSAKFDSLLQSKPTSSFPRLKCSLYENY